MSPAAVPAIPGDGAPQFLVACVRAQTQAALQRGEAQRKGDQAEEDGGQPEFPVGQVYPPARFEKAPCGCPSIGLSLIN